jgi:hypothetical protein
MTEQLAAALLIGAKRASNESALDAPIYIPEDPDWYADRTALVTKQLAAMVDVNTLSVNYLELLVRTHKLIEFMTHNFGNSADWPMEIYAESDEAYGIFENLFDRVKMSVGSLVEV